MKPRCSFCGRTADEVFTFFRPADDMAASGEVAIFICDRCIESCHGRLAAKRDYPVENVEKQQFRQWLQESATETLIRAIVDLQYRDAFLETFAERARLAHVDAEKPPDGEALKLLPASFIRENRVVPWRIEQDRLVVAFYNPLHLLDIYDEIVRLAGMRIRPALVEREVLLRAIESHVAPTEQAAD